jgi:kinesin family protein 5
VVLFVNWIKNLTSGETTIASRGSFVDFTEFQFDAVMPATALQVDVYNTAARPVVLVGCNQRMSLPYFFLCLLAICCVRILYSFRQQHGIFQIVILQLLCLNCCCCFQDVLNGYNGTIMAYGQTGAGKTYTLSDKLSTWGEITAVEGCCATPIFFALNPFFA